MLPKDTPHQAAGFSGFLVSNRDQPFGILYRWPHQSSYPLILSENPFLFLSPLFPSRVCATHNWGGSTHLFSPEALHGLSV